MLPTTDSEVQRIKEYMASQAPDLEITFAQKVYSENILGHVHDVWDVHIDQDRWWVITNPTNLYSQEQFPNMDIAVTFHVGLCLRIPRSEKPKRSDASVEPFAVSYRQIADANESLSHAQEVSDYQAVGVRCREILLAFTDAAQIVLPWLSEEPKPKRADFKAWMDHVCNCAFPGATHENRRHLLKTLLDSAWKFDNWLTHSKTSTWHDAEAAFHTTENALTICISAIIRLARGVPDQCPNCGSSRLSPEFAPDPDNPEDLWERPACDRCGWKGKETRSKPSQPARRKRRKAKVTGDCSVQPVPLRNIRKPR